MTESSKEAWSFATARSPAVYALARRRGHDVVEHAGVPSTDSALCGVTGVVIYRRAFDPTAPNVCPECREEAARNPREPQPSSQELLHDILEPAEGPLRDELRQLLRAGAHVDPWSAGYATTTAVELFDQIIRAFQRSSSVSVYP